MRLRNKKLKILLFCLLGVVVILGGYIGIDQLVFSTKKAGIIDFAQQYTQDLTTAGSVAREDYDKGKDWILENQKQKVSSFMDQYIDPDYNHGTKAYMVSLNEALDKGWKWSEQSVDGIQVVSVKKSPFSSQPSVEVKYHAVSYCETGGALIYVGSGSDGKDVKDGGIYERYYWVKLSLKYDGGWKICRSSLSEGNQPDAMMKPT